MDTKKKEHLAATNEAAAPHPCSLCGHLYKNFAFKGGYICEDCLESIKSSKDGQVPEEDA